MWCLALVAVGTAVPVGTVRSAALVSVLMIELTDVSIM